MTTASALRPYLAVLRTRFALILQYRAAALAGFGTQCWWGAIKVMVLAAFYRGAQSFPMTFSQTVDYIWLGQAFLLLQPWGADVDVASIVRSGDVALERLRPVDTYALWYARAMARRTANPFMRAIPMIITAGFLLPLFGLSKWALSPPAGAQAAILFAISLLLAVALSSAISTLMDVWTVAALSERGVNTIVGGLVIVLSGGLIPLPLFPDWLQPALRFQPFAGLADTPFRIYGAHLSGGAALAGLAAQATWTLVLVAVGHASMTRVMSRVQVQGG
jgi:ABC-2 type transport system permease protein